MVPYTSRQQHTTRCLPSRVPGQYRLGKGGAIHAVNGVELTVEHIQEGGMCLAGRILVIPGLPPEAPVHCSRMKGNEARNTGTPNTRGGGAIYLETDPGAPEPARARAHIYRTVFDGNKDPNGWAAAIGALANTRLTVGASVFVNNHGAPGSAVVDTVGPEALSFNYNTVLHNTTGSLILAAGLRPARQHPVAYVRKQRHDRRHRRCPMAIACCPAAAVMAASMSSRGWMPTSRRGGSPGVDACLNRFWVSLAVCRFTSRPSTTCIQPAQLRRGGRNAGIGANDLGAVEQVDIIYYGGFGTQPHN